MENIIYNVTENGFLSGLDFLTMKYQSFFFNRGFLIKRISELLL